MNPKDEMRSDEEMKLLEEVAGLRAKLAKAVEALRKIAERTNELGPESDCCDEEAKLCWDMTHQTLNDVERLCNDIEK